MLNLHYDADIRTLSITTLTSLILYYNLYYTTDHYLLQIFITYLFSFFSATIVHNTIHHPIFHNKLLNNLYACKLSILYGHPITTLIPGHVLSHHQHTQLQRDIMRTTKMNYSWNLMNFIMFIPTIIVAINKHDYDYFKNKASQQIKNRLYREALFLFIFNCFIFYTNPFNAFFFIYIPQLFSKFSLISINLLQHDGCDPPSDNNKYNFARNFKGPILNYLTCNNGYHTIHHMYPSKHWSLYKEMHENIVSENIHPNLEWENILWYTFLTYIYPGKRLKYDGSDYYTVKGNCVD